MFFVGNVWLALVRPSALKYGLTHTFALDVALVQLVALTLERNQLTGTVEPICDVLEDRRDANNFTIYLRFFHVDCAGNNPEIECSCCTCF